MKKYHADGQSAAPRDAGSFALTKGSDLPSRGKTHGWKRFFAFFGRGVGFVVLLALLGGLLLMTVNAGMVDVTGPHRFSVEQAVNAVGNGEKTYDCILVLGAGLQPDGRPSAMLHDRVEVGCAAYFAFRDGQNGRLPLLMSGDHTGDYNEVAAMKRLAFELGVPGRDVFLDHGGFSTYDSLYRAKQVFGARRVLIVTQGYHLHRALYIAREMGLEADGVAADLRPYRSHTKRIVREWLARYKDFWKAARGVDVDTDGEVYDLSGDGAMTHRS